MGRKINNIIGKRFGRLVVKAFSHTNKNRASCWYVKCDCGKIKVIRGVTMMTGKAMSCGCLQKENMSKRTYKHGMTESATYHCWEAMKDRCLNPKNPAYKNYGGRGIKICERWMSFENFLADIGEKPKGKSLDRMDNNGNYELSNCRWATVEEQWNNKRTNHILVYNGIALTIAQWARRLQITQGTLYSRIHRGWSIEKALGMS